MRFLPQQRASVPFIYHTKIILSSKNDVKGFTFESFEKFRQKITECFSHIDVYPLDEVHTSSTKKNRPGCYQPGADSSIHTLLYIFF